MAQSESNELQPSLILFHLIGYGLLLLVLIDIINITVPPHFLDPVWEFETIGAVVERVPLPLIGLVLIFYGEASFRSKWEPAVLKLLSRISLIVGIVFLLLIPLCISDAFRINKINNDRVDTQIKQQLNQIQQVEQQVGKATANDLESLFARLNTQGGTPDIKNPQELKSRISTEISRAKDNLKAQAEALSKTRRLALIKSSVKWVLGCLVAGDLFIRIWQATRWARKFKKRT